MPYRVKLILATLCLSMFAIGANHITFPDLQTAIIQEDYDQARTFAEYLLAQKLDKVQKGEAMYFLALSHLRLGQHSKARDLFKKLTKQRLSDDLLDKSYLGLIDSLYMDGYHEKGLKYARKILRKHPNSEFLSLIYLKIARGHLKLANWDEAKIYLEKIIIEFPDSLEYYTARQLLEEQQYFTVQVGAFLDRRRAEALSQELIGRGEYAYVVETKSRDDRVFYRVRVGQMKVLSEAKKLKSKLADLGYPTLIYP